MYATNQKRSIAIEMREAAYRKEFTGKDIADIIGAFVTGTTRYDHDAWYILAELVDPGFQMDDICVINPDLTCSRCGHVFHANPRTANYCPNCGAKVVRLR